MPGFTVCSIWPRNDRNFESAYAPMNKRKSRIVIGGYLGLLPAGGVAWDYVQYPLGLAELGFDVYYIEDTRLWPIYQAGAGSGDCSENVAYLAKLMKDFGLENRWAYRDEVSGQCFGLSLEKVQAICASADIFINLSCSTWMRDEYLQIPVRALIDTDPMFTQIQHANSEAFSAGEPGMRRLFDQHTHLFTFGENIGAADCRIPQCGRSWLVTRQPVCLRWWPVLPGPTAGSGVYSTLMNWSAGRSLQYQGESWGQKDTEFRKFMHLPGLVPEVRLLVAVNQTTGTPFPAEDVRAAGWELADPVVRAPDWESYRGFLQAARGEFSVAKETYVKANTGWFSCRSACYLASGRPVVTQDTTWSRFYPTGRGLFSFTDIESAAEALRSIEPDWGLHARAAREVAEEFFSSDRVLTGLLEQLG